MLRLSISRRRARIRVFALIAPSLFALIAHATPDPIQAPDVADPKIQSRATEGGAYSISTRTGTASYKYEFALPPARGGKPPSLGLSYSSSGAIRGDVAQGWTLTTIPAIRRDTLRERVPNDPQYTV